MVNTYRVVLGGKTGVGKTSIFHRVCGLPLDCGKHNAGKTMKDHDCLVTVEVEDKTVELCLGDTQGLETYAKLTRSHFLRSQAVLFVYSATDKDSFDQVIELVNFARIHAQGACFILVRNKIDLDATFSEDEVMSSVSPNAFTLKFKTSAITGDGIQEMLQSLASHLIRRATPMKSIGRSSCLDSCSTEGSAQYTPNSDNDIITLQIEDDANSRQRRKKCCFR